jgi:hypothetical protein
MSRPISARITCASALRHPGYFHQAFHRRQRELLSFPAASRCCGGVEPGDQFLNPGGELADLARQPVDLIEQDGGELGVMLVELAAQGWDESRVLGLEPAAGQASQHPGVALPGDQRFDHVRTDDRRAPSTVRDPSGQGPTARLVHEIASQDLVRLDPGPCPESNAR